MGSALLVSALATGVLALGVVATMVVENSSRIKVSLPPRPPAVPSASTYVAEPEPIVPATEIATAGPARRGAAATGPAEIESIALLAAAFDRRPVMDELHVVEGRVRADQLVATLFASYAASRGPEASRASAWVTSIGWPPQVAGAEFRPGADLRGRPVAVARVLRCDSEDRSWLTLNTSVDIGRGLRTRPPYCPVLAGVAELWSGSRAAMSELPVDSLGPMIDAITELEPQWRGTPMAPDVLSLLVALTGALDGSVSVRLQVTNAPMGRPSGADGHSSSDVRPAGALRDAGARSSS